jgi:hypothetical protein
MAAEREKWHERASSDLSAYVTGSVVMVDGGYRAI